MPRRLKPPVEEENDLGGVKELEDSLDTQSPFEDVGIKEPQDTDREEVGPDGTLLEHRRSQYMDHPRGSVWKQHLANTLGAIFDVLRISEEDNALTISTDLFVDGDIKIGSTTPETPLGLSAQPEVQSMELKWLPQTVNNGYTGTLTNLLMWEVQVSDDNATWYSLEFDGSDWKDTLDAVTQSYSPFLIHTNIPNTGDPPVGKLLYYRVRTVTQVGVSGTRDTESSWSSSTSATTIPNVAWNEVVPPLNGAITSTVGNALAQVTVTFTVGDDTHSGAYSAGEYSGLAGHKIWRKESDDSDIRIVGDINDVSQTTFVDKTAVDNTAYYYGISAYDVNGNESAVTWYGSTVTPQYTTTPSTVTSIIAVATPRKITVSWTPVGGIMGPYVYDIERATNLTNWASWQTDFEGTEVEDDIGEVEYSTIQNYRYRIKSQDSYGNLQATWTATSAAPTRDSSYGTWTLATVATADAKVSASGRQVNILLTPQGDDTPADSTDDLIEEQGFAVQVSQDNSTWYKPNMDASGSTSTTRWYTGAENEYLEVLDFAFIQSNLPLENEGDDSLPAENMTYYYRFKYRRADGTLSGTWSASVTAIALATTARDLVQNAIKVMNLDPNTLVSALEDQVFHISFDEYISGGNTLADMTGNGHTATMTGTPTLVAGQSGNCVDLAGPASGEYGDISHDVSMDVGTGDFAYCIWFNANDITPAAAVDIFGHRDTAAGNVGGRIYLNTDGKPRWIVDIGASQDNVDAAEAIDAGWHFMVCQRVSGTCEMWLDGVVEADTTSIADGVDLDNTANRTIGCNHSHSSASLWDGKLDHFRFFTRSLSEAEIKFLYMIPSGIYGSLIDGVRLAESTVTARAIYVTDLAAINATLGTITGGGGIDVNSNNYWVLSDNGIAGFTEGDFRIGDASNYILFDASAGILTFQVTSFLVETLSTSLLGTLHISNSGTIDSLTDPLEIYCEGTSDNAVLEHPTQLDLRINNVDICSVTSTGLGIGTASPTYELEIVAAGGSWIALNGTNADSGIRIADSAGNLDRVLVRQGTTNDIFIGDVDANGGDIFIRAGGATVMTLLDGGNVGIGTSDIEAWSASYRAIEFPMGAIMTVGSQGAGQSGFYVMSNAYYDGTWKYKIAASDEATLYLQQNGLHSFYTAVAGTADNAISWLLRLTILNNGNVGIGTTSPPYRLTINTGADNVGIRIRNNAAERYRSDFSVTSSGLAINAYDDTGGVYRPMTLSASHLIVNNPIAINDQYLRLNYSGAAFTNQDAYIYFASDAYIQWDESEDYFYASKPLKTAKGRIATTVWSSTSSPTHNTVYDALAGSLPLNEYVIATGTIDQGVAAPECWIYALRKVAAPDIVEFYVYIRTTGSPGRFDAYDGSASVFVPNLCVCF